MFNKNSLFNTNFDLFGDYNNDAYLMKSDIYTKDGIYTIDIDLPGFNKENINIDYNNGYLNITAEKLEEFEDNNNYIRREKIYGTYKRAYYVGKIDENSIKANYTNGVLKINFNEIKELENKKTINID